MHRRWDIVAGFVPLFMRLPPGAVQAKFRDEGSVKAKGCEVSSAKFLINLFIKSIYDFYCNKRFFSRDDNILLLSPPHS